ncbi:MAG TPA: phosphate ABC transporter ATP-binding protein [Acidimicrobiales bacterium]|nr:phosphate ABC transporter ATP-binding protein [Acidimicrobiales bacterium]
MSGTDGERVAGYLPWAPSPGSRRAPTTATAAGAARAGTIPAWPRREPEDAHGPRDVEVLDLDENGGDVSATGVLETRNVSCWFGSAKVLERVSLVMRPRQVTALIGPSGCGKSTFLRVLNRMHELVPIARLSGQVLLDGKDIYGQGVRVTETRLKIGMVFQKPNPFPSMTIAQNVLAGLRLAGLKVHNKDALVQECLTRAGLWKEARNRLNESGAALSGGQQQRLCIARALAVRPEVLLMDEPCSALDPISTGVIEETIRELSKEITIVIVTHNMQQAQRVSHNCALFLLDGEGQPGHIVEQGLTTQIFGAPQDPRTEAYVGGRFG